LVPYDHKPVAAGEAVIEGDLVAVDVEGLLRSVYQDEIGWLAQVRFNQLQARGGGFFVNVFPLEFIKVRFPLRGGPNRLREVKWP
jgi:hypothetical protein